MEEINKDIPTDEPVAETSVNTVPADVNPDIQATGEVPAPKKKKKKKKKLPPKVIVVENLGVRFRIQEQKVDSLKEYFVRLVKRKLNYKEFWALREVNLSIRKGDRVGILGLNGAGKSTLLKCIAGVLKPTEGSVTVKGNIVPLLELGAGFDKDYTGAENIFFYGSMLGYSKAFIKERFNEIVEFSEPLQQRNSTSTLNTLTPATKFVLQLPPQTIQSTANVWVTTLYMRQWQERQRLLLVWFTTSMYTFLSAWQRLNATPSIRKVHCGATVWMQHCSLFTWSTTSRLLPINCAKMQAMLTKKQNSVS